MDTKQTQKTRGHHFKPFWIYLGSNMAKIGQNRPKFMDDPKIFRKKKFFVKVSKRSNSQSWQVKIEIWRHLRHLENFLVQKMARKCFFFIDSKWSNSQSYHVKMEIGRHFGFYPILRVILAWHLENVFSKYSVFNSRGSMIVLAC